MIMQNLYRETPAIDKEGENMAFKAIYGNPLQDPKSDYQSAVEIGNIRFGKDALYIPAFPVGAQYLPLETLDRAWVQKSSISPKGCCGGQLQVFVVRVQYGGEFYQSLTFAREQDANRALGLLKERRPELPGAPEGMGPGSSIV